jgi:integrase
VDLSSYPFRRYEIKKEKTDHRTLTLSEIHTLATAELSGWVANFSRDMFMLTFYLIGINFKDLSELTDIIEGRIKYTRSKGKKRYSIFVHTEVMEIIERYRGKKRLVNIVEHYSNYLVALHEVDDKLKEVAKTCGINKELTTYYAQHSWATLASEIGIAEDVIAYGLGHTISNEITPIYIDYNLEKVDKANRKPINKVLGIKTTKSHA